MSVAESSATSDILIIGGGVIGMSCAYELSQRGARVTVIDRGEPGFGCSYGNAGWVTPCFALPLPMPGMFFKSIGWLLKPESPLYIKPEASWALLRWLTRFLLSMNQRQMERSVAALTEISKYSIEAYARMNERFGGAFSFEKRGLLMVGQSEAGRRSAIEEMELVARHGIPGKVLDEEGCKALEPALTGRLKGGVYFPEEAHVEPLAVVRALGEAAERAGVRVLSRAEVFDFECGDGRIEGVRTTRGPMRASQYVLATGSWSLPLARKLGIRVPILGGKGYALISKPLDPQPRVPLMLIEKKIAVTPRKDSLRIAGTLELVNGDESITPRRVDAIIRGSREFMNLPAEPEISEVWRGLRPCTPDGVPMIGYSKRYRNLLVAAGHQMLGLQSAPGTGRLAADLLTGAAPAFDPAPFRVDRF